MACTEGVGFLQELGGCCLEVATWRDAQGALQISKDHRTQQMESAEGSPTAEL